MTGWRCAVLVGNAEALCRRLKSNISSRLFEAVQLAGIAAVARPTRTLRVGLCELYLRGTT